MSILETALSYAARGIPVFPCMEATKTPRTKHGLKDRTCDTQQIRLWWEANPNYNLAIVPEDAGWCVVDLDLGSQWTDTTPTYTVSTPSGGRHLYFAGSLPPSVGKLGPRIDTRGVGSYVLVPPSYVKDVEKGYEGAYTVDALAGDAKTPLPEWIVEAVGTGSTEIRSAAGDVELDTYENRQKGLEFLRTAELATEGNASDTFYRLAARLMDFGNSEMACCELIRMFNPSYELWDIANRVHNASKHRQNEIGSDAPRPLELVPPGMAATMGEPPKLGDILPPSGATVPPGEKPKGGLVWGDQEPMGDIDWLWHGHFGRGILHLLGGKPGIGKSTIMAATAAVFSCGGTWPDGSRAPKGRSILWSSEDHWNNVIKPRFVANGGDLRMVARPPRMLKPDGKERGFDPSRDLETLMELIKDAGDIAYVGLDPLVGVMRGRKNNASNNDSEVRDALDALVGFAEERGVIVEGIVHLTKGSKGQSRLERITGSGAFGAVARVVHFVEAFKDQPSEWCQIKTNLTREGEIMGYKYTTASVPVSGVKLEHPKIVWDGTGIKDFSQPEECKEETKADRAVQWLLDTITANSGSMWVKDLERKCREEADFSWGTVKNARIMLGSRIVIRKRDGIEHGIHNDWTLPEVLGQGNLPKVPDHEPAVW
jgi:putative DNA primase/helicase